MKVYKLCMNGGNCCVFDELEDAKEMFISDIEYDEENISTDEFHVHREEINKLTDETLEKGIYIAGDFSLEVGEMSEEKFNNLSEFEGY